MKKKVENQHQLQRKILRVVDLKKKMEIMIVPILTIRDKMTKLSSNLTLNLDGRSI